MNLQATIDRDRIKRTEQKFSTDPNARLLKVACAKCRNWIANVDVNDLDLPLKGSMFRRRVGCESWPMPGPDAMGMDLVCPHSVTEDPMDLHLFIPNIAGKELEADEICLHGSIDVLKVEKKAKPEIAIELCPCGCGREPVVDHKSGNRYAHAGCHLRWLHKKD